MEKKIVVIAVSFLIIATGIGFLAGQRISNKKPSNQVGSNNSDLSKGKSLDLSGQQLTALPDSVTNQTDITSLNLSNNQLTSLPANIAKMANLETLNVENNRLETLPPEIGQLRNLKNADFSNNRLTSLPMELGNLTGLRVLNLAGYKSSMSDIDRIKAMLPDTTIKI